MKKSLFISLCIPSMMFLGFIIVHPSGNCENIMASNIEALSQSPENGNQHDYPTQKLIQETTTVQGVEDNKTKAGFKLFAKKNTSNPTIVAEGELGANTSFETLAGTGMNSLFWYCGGTGSGCSKYQERQFVTSESFSFVVWKDNVIINGQILVNTNNGNVTCFNMNN